MPADHRRTSIIPSRGVTHAHAARSEASARIRPLRSGDLGEIVALRRHAFQRQHHSDPAALTEYFARVLLRNPWCKPDLQSLVYENVDGKVAGFIGAIPRPMVFRGEPIRVVVATQMMVAPDARGIAGRELVRALLSGPQDLTITDAANTPARQIWKSVGAVEAPLYGFEWERVVRPFQRLRLRSAGKGVLIRAAGLAVQPLLGLGDTVAARLTPYRIHRPAGRLDPLDPSAIASSAGDLLTECDLAPAYDAHSLRWLFAEAAGKSDLGPLAGGVVRGDDDRVLGWFAHYLAPGGTSRVLQMGARRRTLPIVMEHLVHDAKLRGAVAVSGRLDACVLPFIEDSQCEVRRTPPWTLAHSRRPDLLREVETGRAFISRLDGEFWLNF